MSECRYCHKGFLWAEPYSAKGMGAKIHCSNVMCDYES